MNTKSLFIVIVIIIPLCILPSVIVVLSCDQSSPIKLRFASDGGVSDRGVSGYEIAGSVRYRVEVNFSFVHQSGPSGRYFFKIARLNDRQPNSELTQYCGPYQESELEYSSIIGSDTTPFLCRDRFNNTYDVFNSTDLLPGEIISLNQIYQIKLNEVSFTNIDPSKIGEYDTSDEMFSLYCNNSEKYYEKDDFNINATSYSVVNPSDNPVVKAQKICDWVGNHLEYDSARAGEMGAKWAYDNGIGDCSEYSSLMVTLLRCQGIPARKVVGYLITKDVYTEPSIGQEWSFGYRSYGEFDISSHAWVEYYVPNVGWIACDPTWDDSNYLNYFNRIDCFRLNLNVGAWFSIPLFPDESEFSNPCIAVSLRDFSAQNPTLIDFEYVISIKVVDTNFSAPEIPFLVVINGILACEIIVILALLIIYVKKRLSLFLFAKN